MHARFLPKPHRFVYRIFMLAVDLDELPLLDRNLHLFSVNRPNLYAFREVDFLPASEPLHNASDGSYEAQPSVKSSSLKARGSPCPRSKNTAGSTKPGHAPR